MPKYKAKPIQISNNDFANAKLQKITIQLGTLWNYNYGLLEFYSLEVTYIFKFN